MKYSIAVKDIVSFLYSGGDLTNEFFINKRSMDGQNAHLYLQKKYNKESKSEYYVKHTVEMNEDEITVVGFIDGVIIDDGKLYLEEIKSTKLNLEDIGLDYRPEHLAQLKMYAYIYGLQNNLNVVNLRLTYISIESYKTRFFEMALEFNELKEFFESSLENYMQWQYALKKSNQEKIKTIAEMVFPFPNMREGQRDLMKACYYAMTQNDIMYAIAPTGIGKTIATMFSSLKSITTEEEKLFYLTAKGTGKKVAVEAVMKLMEQGLKLKTLVLTSKTKSCLNYEKNCDPENCRFAKGFFDRLKNATEDIFKETSLYDYDTITEYATKHEICSFEFSLYLSYFCDLIIADYNYAFDPSAHLIRYFEDDTYKPKLLIDEAHNLISRSKDMYSTSFSTANLTNLVKNLKKVLPTIKGDVKPILTAIEQYNDKVSLQTPFFDSSYDMDVYTGIKKICGKCEMIFVDKKEFKGREEALEDYFILRNFLLIADLYSTSHRFLVKKEAEEFILELLCLDASKYILDTIKNRTFGTVFFSATLYPLKYHIDLLTCGEGKHIVLPSPFNQENLNLIIRDDISTKYKDRKNSLDEVVETIDILASSKVGNYIVFFPSYQYLEMVADCLEDLEYELLIQKPNMTEKERDICFDKFKDSSVTKIGLFVMGGVFSEGLDYLGDLLNGVVIVGVGLPQINFENNLLKSYFDEIYDSGFDYAYTFAGFTKVVQAAGRVIRSDLDRGVVILVDERFSYQLYRQLMPKHWSHFKKINNDERLKNDLVSFWAKK